MARIDTLTNFLTDVAESIRTKEGTTEQISASEFDTRIANLSGGGELQYATGTKNLNYTESSSGDVVIEVNDLTFTPKYILVTRQSSSNNVGLWASPNKYIFIAVSGGLFNQDVTVTNISGTTAVLYGTNKVTVNITDTGFNIVSNDAVEFSAANYDYIAIG